MSINSYNEHALHLTSTTTTIATTNANLSQTTPRVDIPTPLLGTQECDKDGTYTVQFEDGGEDDGSVPIRTLALTLAET